MPKSSVPAVAPSDPAIRRRRAPHESTKTPVGICIRM
jgi:hypothetical protein